MKDNIKIEFINESNVHLVNLVIQGVYADSYEKLYLPSDDIRLKAHLAKENIAVLAFVDEKAVGLINLKQSSFNESVYEIGMLSVLPEFRKSLVASCLVKFAKFEFAKVRRFSAVFMENVSSHYYTQRKAYYAGCIDSAVLISTMPALDIENERLSYVMSFWENSDNLSVSIYIPKAYADTLLAFYHGFKSRLFMPACYDRPLTQKSVFARSIYETLGLIKETVVVIGEDFHSKVIELDEYCVYEKLITAQVYLPLDSPFISYAVDCLRKKGYYIGGVLPYWLGSDCLVMQKSSEVKWDNLCLYSKKSRYLLDLVRKDYTFLYG